MQRLYDKTRISKARSDSRVPETPLSLWAPVPSGQSWVGPEHRPRGQNVQRRGGITPYEEDSSERQGSGSGLSRSVGLPSLQLFKLLRCLWLQFPSTKTFYFSPTSCYLITPQLKMLKLSWLPTRDGNSRTPLLSSSKHLPREAGGPGPGWG